MSETVNPPNVPTEPYCHPKGWCHACGKEKAEPVLEFLMHWEPGFDIGEPPLDARICSSCLGDAAIALAEYLRAKRELRETI